MKKIISILLVLAMTASALNVGYADENAPVDDSAEDIVVSEAAVEVEDDTEALAAAADTIVTYSDDTAVYTFDKSLQTITKIEFKQPSDEYGINYDLNIPSSIVGVEVKEIASNACDGSKISRISNFNLTIPETVTYIDRGAFYNFSDINTLRITLPNTPLDIMSDLFESSSCTSCVVYCYKDSYINQHWGLYNYTNYGIIGNCSRGIRIRYIDAQKSKAEAYKQPEISSGSVVRNSNGKLNSVQIIPYQEVYEDYIRDGITLSIENGRFDSSLMNECEYKVPYSGETWSDFVNWLGRGELAENALNRTVCAAGSNKLPYRLEYINETTVKAYLFPLPEEYAGVNNSIVSAGIPTYDIALPAIAGTKQGDIKIDIKDDIGCIENCSLTYAYVGKSTVSYTKNDNVYMEKNIETQPNTQFDNSVIIKPKNEILLGDYVEIKIENGSFDSKLVGSDEYIYHVDKSLETWDVLMQQLERGGSAENVLNRTVCAAHSNKLPYKLTYVDSQTLEVELFPLPAEFAGVSNSNVAAGIPVYSVKLPIISGSNNGKVSIAVNGKDTTIRNSGWYTAARINSEPEYEAYSNFYVHHVPDVSRGQNLTIYPQNALVFKPDKEVYKDTELYINVKNGKFDKSLIDTCKFTTKYQEATYDDLYEDLNKSTADNILYRYIYEERSNHMPYKMEYVSESTLKVTLFPLPGYCVGLAGSGYVSAGIPVYFMRLPIIAGNNLGAVEIKIDSNNGSTIMPAGWYTAANVISNDKPITPTTEPSTQPTTATQATTKPTTQTTTQKPTTQTTTQKPTTQATTQKPTTQATTQKTTEKPTETTTKAAVTEKPSSTTTKAVVTEKPSETTTKTIVTEKPSVTTTKTVVTEKPSETTTKTIVTEKPTETTTKAIITEGPTETTTKRSTSSNSGGGGGKGPSKDKDNTTTATTVTEASTETTTAAKTTGGSKQNDPSDDGTGKSTVISGNVYVTIGKKAVTIDDKEYAIDTAAYIQPESNSTLVPLRFVALAIAGGDIEKADSNKNISWDAATKTATITAGGNVISFTAGSELMTINNNPQIMENGVKAEIKDSRMFIPFRALGKALGVQVDWDAESKTAIYRVK